MANPNRSPQSFQLIPFAPLPDGVELNLQGDIKREADIPRQGNGERDSDGDQLHIHYKLIGSLDAVVIDLAPTPTSDHGSALARRDGLWQTTCLEFFVGKPGDSAYWEVNLAPSGDWNIYRLSGYRSNLQPDQSYQALVSQVTYTSQCFCLESVFPLPPSLRGANELELAISAVIQFKQGPISYWTLHHGGPEADFHRRDGFTLRL